MVKSLKKFILYIFNFFNKMMTDKVGIYTAQASFFILLSIFPFLIFLFNIIGTISIDQQHFIDIISTNTPSAINPLIMQIVKEMQSHASGTAISVSAIFTIWAASKGFLAVMFGLYEINKVNQDRNYFISRFISMIYVILFSLSLIITIIILVFGNRIYALLMKNFEFLRNIKGLTTSLRYLVVFMVLSIFFFLIYKLICIRIKGIVRYIPGAMLSALGWILFAYGFSIYVDNFFNMTYLYGSMTAVIILMFYIYFCIYIFFIGSEFNRILYYHLINRKKAKK